MGYEKPVRNSAWDILAQRRDTVREETARRRREILERIPDIGRIEREMAALSAGITRTVLSDPAHAGELMESLATQSLALQKERETLLSRHGYPADALADRHVCESCRDTGYIGPHMCNCLKILLREQAYARLDEVAPVQQCTFENFDLSMYPNEPGAPVNPSRRMGEVLSFCREYARAFSLSSPSLLFLGRTGLGKTHLSLAIAGQVAASGFGVIYSPVQKLFDRLESEKFSRDEEIRSRYMQSLQSVLDCDLLVLDDLGTEFATSFTLSALYNIVNSRLVEGRPTIISTNLELADIETKYSQRMVSRLVCDYTVLKFFGRDIRFLRKTQGRPLSAPDRSGL